MDADFSNDFLILDECKCRREMRIPANLNDFSILWIEYDERGFFHKIEGRPR